LSGLLLQHEDEARGEGAREHTVEPRRGDGVRQIGNDLETGCGPLGREGGERVLDGVALEKMEPHGKIGVSG